VYSRDGGNRIFEYHWTTPENLIFPPFIFHLISSMAATLEEQTSLIIALRDNHEYKILEAQEVEEYARAFGCTIQCRDIPGIFYPLTMRSFGLNSVELALALCQKLDITYSKQFTKNAQFRECCNRILDDLEKRKEEPPAKRFKPNDEDDEASSSSSSSSSSDPAPPIEKFRCVCILEGHQKDGTVERQAVTYATYDDVTFHQVEALLKKTHELLPAGALPTILGALTTTPCHYDMRQFAGWCGLNVADNLLCHTLDLTIQCLETLTSRSDWLSEYDYKPKGDELCWVHYILNVDKA
jgi:hypothetical protein